MAWMFSQKIENLLYHSFLPITVLASLITTVKEIIFVSIYFQRDKLEDEFNELFKNAPDVKEKLEAELRQEEGAGGSAEDEEHLVDDYLSDEGDGEEKDKPKEEDEQEDNCTKVSRWPLSTCRGGAREE